MIALWNRLTKKENKAGLARRICNGSAQVETKNCYMCDLTGFQSTPLINKGWSIAGNLQLWNFRIKTSERKHQDRGSEYKAFQAAGQCEGRRILISVIMKDGQTSSVPIKVDETAMEENILEVNDLQTDLSGKGPYGFGNESMASVASEILEMEPFLQYLPMIERLLFDIGLLGFSVEALQHGYSFQNCVYALKSSEDDKEQYVLRVPVSPYVRETDEKCVAIENDVTILGFLATSYLFRGLKPTPRQKRTL